MTYRKLIVSLLILHIALQVTSEIQYDQGNNYQQNLKRFEEQLDKGSSAILPKHIFQSYRTYKLPLDARILTLKLIGLNPEHQYHLYNDDDINTFIEENVKDDTLKQMFQKYPLRIMKANFWKYFILHEKGGFYADIDLETFQPIKSWDLNPSNQFKFIMCSASDKSSTQNNNKFSIDSGAIFSIPKHPLLLKIIETFKTVYTENSNQIDTKKFNENTVDTFTGPEILTRAICEFFGIQFDKNNQLMTKQLVDEINKVGTKANQQAKQFEIKINQNGCFNNKENSVVHQKWSVNQTRKDKDTKYISWVNEQNQLINFQALDTNLDKKIEGAVQNFPNYYAYLIDQEYKFVLEYWDSIILFKDKGGFKQQQCQNYIAQFQQQLRSDQEGEKKWTQFYRTMYERNQKQLKEKEQELEKLQKQFSEKSENHNNYNQNNKNTDNNKNLEKTNIINDQSQQQIKNKQKIQENKQLIDKLKKDLIQKNEFYQQLLKEITELEKQNAQNNKNDISQQSNQNLNTQRSSSDQIKVQELQAELEKEKEELVKLDQTFNSVVVQGENITQNDLQYLNRQILLQQNLIQKLNDQQQYLQKKNNNTDNQEDSQFQIYQQELEEKNALSELYQQNILYLFIFFTILVCIISTTLIITQFQYKKLQQDLNNISEIEMQ